MMKFVIAASVLLNVSLAQVLVYTGEANLIEKGKLKVMSYGYGYNPNQDYIELDGFFIYTGYDTLVVDESDLYYPDLASPINIELFNGRLNYFKKIRVGSMLPNKFSQERELSYGDTANISIHVPVIKIITKGKESSDSIRVYLEFRDPKHFRKRFYSRSIYIGNLLEPYFKEEDE